MLSVRFSESDPLSDIARAIQGVWLPNAQSGGMEPPTTMPAINDELPAQ